MSGAAPRATTRPRRPRAAAAAALPGAGPGVPRGAARSRASGPTRSRARRARLAMGHRGASVRVGEFSLPSRSTARAHAIELKDIKAGRGQRSRARTLELKPAATNERWGSRPLTPNLQIMPKSQRPRPLEKSAGGEDPGNPPEPTQGATRAPLGRGIARATRAPPLAPCSKTSPPVGLPKPALSLWRCDADNPVDAGGSRARPASSRSASKTSLRGLRPRCSSFVFSPASCMVRHCTSTHAPRRHRVVNMRSILIRHEIDTSSTAVRHKFDTESTLLRPQFESNSTLLRHQFEISSTQIRHWFDTDSRLMRRSFDANSTLLRPLAVDKPEELDTNLKWFGTVDVNWPMWAVLGPTLANFGRS